MALSPNELPNDVESLKDLLLAIDAENARLTVEREHLEQERRVPAVEVDRLAEQNERLDHIIKVLRRAQFGCRSERISDEQMALALEDVETALAAEDALADRQARGRARPACQSRPLPCASAREEIVIEPEAKSCPCWAGRCTSSARTCRSASTGSPPGYA